MQEKHKNALDQLFADAQVRKSQEAAERAEAARQLREFNEMFVRLGQEVVTPTFMELQSYLASRGVEAFLDTQPVREQEPDDVPIEYHFRLVLGRGESSAGTTGYIEVVGMPASREVQLRRCVKGGHVQPLPGNPQEGIAGITAELLHAHVRSLLMIHLA